MGWLEKVRALTGSTVVSVDVLGNTMGWSGEDVAELVENTYVCVGRCPETGARRFTKFGTRWRHELVYFRHELLAGENR